MQCGYPRNSRLATFRSFLFVVFVVFAALLPSCVLVTSVSVALPIIAVDRSVVRILQVAQHAFTSTFR